MNQRLQPALDQGLEELPTPEAGLTALEVQAQQNPLLRAQILGGGGNAFVQSLLATRPGTSPGLPSPTLGSASPNELLTDHGWLDTITDAEATSALDGLLSLPADARSQALDALDDDAFQALLTELPEERQRELAPLVFVCSDPRRKLAIWQVGHLAEARAALEGDLENPSFFDDSEAADQARHRDQVRLDTLDATEDEVADEVRHLEERLARGETVPPEEIDALAARKSLELELERSYGVNLTNQGGLTGLLALLRGEDQREAGRRVWSFEELVEVEGALSRLPAAHVRDNPALDEIRRAAAPTTGALVLHGDAGRSLDKRIEIYDEATTRYAPTSGPVEEEDLCAPVNPLRTERTSALAGHAPGQLGPSGELSLLEDILTHEVGHAVHTAQPALLASLESAAQWQRVDRDGLADWGLQIGDARLSERDMAAVDQTRGQPFSRRQPIRHGDWAYSVDPNRPEDFLIHLADAIPEEEQARLDSSGAFEDQGPTGCPRGADDWSYARTSPEDHFAELYTKAVHQPEALYRDLVSRQAETIAAKEEERRQLLGWLDEARQAGDLSDAARLEVQVQYADAKITYYQTIASARQAEWALIRDQVWGGPLDFEEERP